MKLLKLSFSILVIIILIVSCSSNSNSDNDIVVETINNVTNEIDITLSENEIEDLLFLREEEKLARDVYLFAYSVHNITVFKNIASSEQTHMDNVLVLLNKYNIDDPILEEQGKFSNKTLQNLYNILTKKCELSLLEALLVGNTIEDLDINDITINETRTIKEDLLLMYSLLKCGSRNHLRNFNKQVLSNSGEYVPQFISIDNFNNIINSGNEKCVSN